MKNLRIISGHGIKFHISQKMGWKYTLVFGGMLHFCNQAAGHLFRESYNHTLDIYVLVSDFR